MTLDDLKARIPDYAKDLRLNLGSVLAQPELTPQQLWGSALAAALASRNADLSAAIAASAQQHLKPEAVSASKTAAALMGMNNIYYRFVHMVSEPSYATMPAKLRMNAIANPGVDHIDFELYSIAVSAVNGCGMCLDSHEKTVAKKGVGKDVVQAVVRIAAVIHAVAVTLEAEGHLAAA